MNGPQRRTNKTQKIRRAIERGLDFIYQTACIPEHFEMWGHDFLGCFHCIESTSKDPKLRRTALRMGSERAIHWLREYAHIAPDLDASEIKCLVFGSYAAEHLGVNDQIFKHNLLTAADTA